MGSSSSQPQVTTQTSAPPPWAAQHFQDIASEAKGLYNAGTGYKPWTGATIAPLAQQSIDALGATEQLARQPNELATSAYNNTNSIINAQGLSANMQPSLDVLTSIAQGQGSGLDALANRIGSQQASMASGAGRYGSGKHTEAMTRAMTESLLPFQMQAAGGLADIYGAGLNRSMQATQMAPTVDEMRFANANRLAGIGDFWTGRAQDDLNQQINRYNQEQARPWEQLARYQGILGGLGQLGGTTTQTQPRQGASTAQGAIGGALAGGSLLGPLGAIGGGLLGAFL